MYHCWHIYSDCGIPGQVRGKHAGQYLIQANLFQLHLNKEGSANIHPPSFHVLWQSWCCSFVSNGLFSWMSSVVVDFVSFEMSLQSLKHQLKYQFKSTYLTSFQSKVARKQEIVCGIISVAGPLRLALLVLYCSLFRVNPAATAFKLIFTNLLMLLTPLQSLWALTVWFLACPCNASAMLD